MESIWNLCITFRQAPNIWGQLLGLQLRALAIIGQAQIGVLCVARFLVKTSWQCEVKGSQVAFGRPTRLIWKTFELPHGAAGDPCHLVTRMAPGKYESFYVVTGGNEEFLGIRIRRSFVIVSGDVRSSFF